MKVSLELTADQVNTLNTTPVELVPAKPGVFYFPKFLLVTKKAGSTYTIVGGGNIGPGWDVFAAYALPGSGLLDQSDETSHFRMMPAITAPTDWSSAFSKSLVIRTDSGSFSGSGSNVVVTVEYEEYPCPW